MDSESETPTGATTLGVPATGEIAILPPAPLIGVAKTFGSCSLLILQSPTAVLALIGYEPKTQHGIVKLLPLMMHKFEKQQFHNSTLCFELVTCQSKRAVRTLGLCVCIET
jgi:hypothetical protein